MIGQCQWANRQISIKSNYQINLQNSFITRPMVMPFLLILLLLIFNTHQNTNKFGLLTVTHSRDGDYSVLEKYLKHYAETQCYAEFITQINLVWNNEVSPESTSIFDRKQFWKIPVYFYRTTFNSMDHRYRLPKQSNAELLYSLDDDIIVDCHTFKITLEQYNRVGNGRLGRIVTNQVRGFKFTPSPLQNKQFSYQGHPQARYFTISEPGAAFIPRHYLQLYYLKLNELLELRKEIIDVRNCDDIFFYAFVQHFYPQLPAVYVRGQKDYKNTDPKVGQSKVKNVYPTRSKCITDISKVLGYNPLRYYSKNSKTYLRNWQYGNTKTILQEKIRGLNSVEYQQPREKGDEQNAANQEAIKIQKSELQTAQINLQSKQNKKIQEQVVREGEKDKQPSNIDTKSKKQGQTVQNQNKNLQKPDKTTQDTKVQDKPKQNTIIPQKRQQKQQKSTYLYLSPQRQMFLQILLIIFLAIVCLRLYRNYCDKRAQYRIQVSQQEESNPTSVRPVRLPDRY